MESPRAEFPALGLTSASTPADGRGSVTPRKRILVVDDEDALLALLRILLTDSGFDVSIAHDGREALDLTMTQRYDLILLDLEMPGVNGRTFFREFRSKGELTPVVLISAYGAEEANREMGAQGFVAKPFEPERLVQKVEEVLAK